MKRLARGYVWWPGINKAHEFAVQTCAECQENQKLPTRAPMHPWEWPDRPWARIHIDYAGTVKGRMILVIVDFHSKWIEAHVVNGIKHLTSAPYHPASNGLAERAVQILKNTLKKEPGGISLEIQISRFLFSYRITPHCTTGVAPSELLMGRRL